MWIILRFATVDLFSLRPMRPALNWQTIAERLAESGWSWRHFALATRAKGNLHVAEARNDDGHTHVVAASSVQSAFTALEQSVHPECK